MLPCDCLHMSSRPMQATKCTAVLAQMKLSDLSMKATRTFTHAFDVNHLMPWHGTVNMGFTIIADRS